MFTPDLAQLAPIPIFKHRASTRVHQSSYNSSIHSLFCLRSCWSLSRTGVWVSITISATLALLTVDMSFDNSDTELSLVSIPTTTNANNAVYYNIQVKLPLRSMTIPRRYSEFYRLVQQLSDELGIHANDFPYKIPPKSYVFSSSAKTVAERKEVLARFMNQAVMDREIQQNRIFLEFLKLPPDFDLSTVFKKGLNVVSDLSIPPRIDENQWLELYRRYRQRAHEFESAYKESPTLKEKIAIQKDVKELQTHLDQLRATIDKLKISAKDKLKKNAAVANLKELILQIGAWSPGRREKDGHRSPQRASETKESLPLNNEELLQHQIQIHKSQDQELWELRKLIQRQKELGQLINTEVEEQNELLDGFEHEVENTAAKVKGARQRARKIL